MDAGHSLGHVLASFVGAGLAVFDARVGRAMALQALLQLRQIRLQLRVVARGRELHVHTDAVSGRLPDLDVDIQLSEPVALTFSLKYLVNFCKASGLSSRVKLCLSSEVPLLVEYALTNNSYLRFYLAPKVCL